MHDEAFHEHFHGPNEAQTCDVCLRGEFANRRADGPRLSARTAVTLVVTAGLAVIGILALVAGAASRARRD